MGTAQSEQKNSDRVEVGGGGFYGQPGFPHFRVNRTKIVGTAQRKVSRKTAMGLKGGRDFMDSPGSPTFM